MFTLSCRFRLGYFYFRFIGVFDLVPLYTSISAAILNRSSSSSSSFSVACALTLFPLLLEILFRSFFTPVVGALGSMECRSGLGVLLSLAVDVAVAEVDFLRLLLLALAPALALSLFSATAMVVCFLGGLGLGLACRAGLVER